jgi:hypothetical protein
MTRSATTASRQVARTVTIAVPNLPTFAKLPTSTCPPAVAAAAATEPWMEPNANSTTTRKLRNVLAITAPCATRPVPLQQHARRLVIPH